MATRDQEARSLVEAAQAAEAMLGQTLPDMVAARPPGVVVPPVPQMTTGPDGTVQVLSPVLGDQSGSIMNGGKVRRTY